MLELTITADAVNLRSLDKQEGNARFAAAIALTRTAKLARGAVVDEMKTVFDRPTRYTLNSTYVLRAMIVDLRAEVGF